MALLAGALVCFVLFFFMHRALSQGAVRMNRRDCEFSIEPLTLSPPSALLRHVLSPHWGKKMTTAAHHGGSVKYGQTAWRISLPLITKARGRERKPYNFIVCVSRLPIATDGTASAFTERLSRRCSIALAFCGPFVTAQTLSSHLHSPDTYIRDGWMARSMDDPSHGNNAVIWKCEKHFFFFSGDGKKLMMLALCSTDRLLWVAICLRTPDFLGLVPFSIHPRFWMVAFILV